MTTSLEVYREHNGWFFDDESVGLKHEAFVAGVPEIILRYAGKDAQRVIIEFSALEFEGSVRATRIEDKTLSFPDELGPLAGVRYQMDDSGLIGWLCPSFRKYFRAAPNHLFIKITAIQ